MNHRADALQRIICVQAEAGKQDLEGHPLTNMRELCAVEIIADRATRQVCGLG